jgi:hypothetical protein
MMFIYTFPLTASIKIHCSARAAPTSATSYPSELRQTLKSSATVIVSARPPYFPELSTIDQALARCRQMFGEECSWLAGDEAGAWRSDVMCGRNQGSEA